MKGVSENHGHNKLEETQSKSALENTLIKNHLKIDIMEKLCELVLIIYYLGR